MIKTKAVKCTSVAALIALFSISSSVFAIDLVTLAGDWRFEVLSVPNSMTEGFLNTETGQTRQADSSGNARINERLVDVFFKGGFESAVGTVSVSASGTISGDIDGSASTSSDGTVTLDFGEGPEVFRMNASKNFMVRSRTDSDEQRLTVIVKAPSSTSLADLAGPWRLTNLIMPNRLREV